MKLTLYTDVYPDTPDNYPYQAAFAEPASKVRDGAVRWRIDIDTSTAKAEMRPATDAESKGWP